MKTKFWTKRKTVSVIAMSVAIVLAALICVPTLTAQANYTGQSGEMTRDQLHSATLAASVSSDTPAITVFMHGLGANAGVWSNSMQWDSHESCSGSGNFTYDSVSIIEKMRDTASSGMQLYRAVTDGESSFTLYSEYGGADPDKVSAIPDFSKHTVIVLDIGDTYIAMENVYARLHYVLDKISYDYYVQEGTLPRINLIGHSMGGLLNMQYAIEHPKNVAALVSLGTPYNGSWYDNWFVEMIGIDEFRKQPCMSGTCGHSYYFCDVETRRNKWNEVYAQNPHIKFYALSGETSLDILDYIVYSDCLLVHGEMAVPLVATVQAGFSVLGFLTSFLPGDVCVDTDSQKAVGYDGVINYNKRFTYGNCNVDKRAQNQFPVPHNLETYDSDMHNCILKLIDYGSNTIYHSYTQHGMKVGIIAKSDNKWLIQLTNNTGSARSFEYNQMMCFTGDAQSWNGLGHIEKTDILANGASTIIEIQENGTATDITLSYDSGGTRYIFYANNLDGNSCTMSSYGSTKSCYNYTQRSMKVSILSKYEDIWTIKLTNNTGSARSFEYNAKMCFDGDAQSWNGLTDITTTVEVANGDSTIIKIQENGTATSIALSYTSGSTRYIFYANNLNTSGTMLSYGTTKAYYSYTKNGMKMGIVGKNGSTWLLRLTNNTGSTRSFEYNAKMCFDGDASSWVGLTDIATVYSLASGESTIIQIQENGTATSIAVSYTSGSTRYIFYANNLNISGTMSSYGNSVPTYSYTQHGMKVGIVGKNGTKWLIKLTNNTGSAQSFYYNGKMCFDGDAQNWTGLSDIKQTANIANGETVQLEIEENGTATAIVISYTNSSTRYIFYANNLNDSGTMSSYGSTKTYYSYTKNGMQVSIVGKDGGTWLIELTNRTGSGRTFYYNRRMCFDGDAQNWKNLGDVSNIYLANYATTTVPLEISENAFATAIAISYKDGDYRYVFWANNLDASGTMSAYEEDINTKEPEDPECVAEGTLITLADGTQKAVEDLTGDELLLVWDMETGTYGAAPIMFVDSDLIGHYEVIELSFSDGTTVEVISEHGFWDVNLNEYVYLDENADDYIGHKFVKQNGEGYTEVTLTDVEISVEVTRAYSPVTYGHLCYYVNGMLSMPGGISGLFNIFDIDAETMSIDEEAYAADIAEYGVYTYEEFSETFPVSEEVFEAFNGKYLKVAIGKGQLTEERIGELIERYSEFF